MNFAKFLRTPFLTELTPPVATSKTWKIAKTITLQINVLTQVAENRVSDHYARNAYIKIFL